MKFRRTLRFHSLTRVRIRQSWHKNNLFNIHRNMPIINVIGRTFFQQKWRAKSMLRGYHGEHIKERQWERMFSRRLQSVVNMNPKYMARYDGSEQASGRGRGLEEDPIIVKNQNPKLRFHPDNGTNRDSNMITPYMQMTFAPMERRLDIAVYRALFASSARQARQFVVHGAVTVNGKKMIYPGYLLNPGDMFQVDVDHVLFATGARKLAKDSNFAKSLEDKARTVKTTTTPAAEGEDGEAAEATVETKTLSSEEANKVFESRFQRSFPTLVQRVKNVFGRNEAKSEEEAQLALRRAMRSWIHRTVTPTPGIAAPGVAAMLGANPASKPGMSEIITRLRDMVLGDKTTQGDRLLTDREQNLFRHVMTKEAENPLDPTKSYLTPWQPRKYMSAFAYIPRYLEVNQKICAAVYLRHPVCRPGMSEIPSPFTPELTQLAFNWYLRRH
ncbi:hypothetical protein SCUCBS95973_006943 [Sporothrix curviconia]|uniref:RNA-binding S4 domain-containing protein n=1 Tax=Sporothrix curviconia TaxID=1260050 RepID=A0ABP0CAH8_9PEZI